ncbi:hypothetical protein TNCV_2973801 [Trichonephila clavipes]|nr:hypothetical protein TNCV_2973801 [Trichonephila clavipes]
MKSFEAKKSRTAHTKVVRFATDNVEDAATCSSAPRHLPAPIVYAPREYDPATRADDEHSLGRPDPARPGDSQQRPEIHGHPSASGCVHEIRAVIRQQGTGSLKRTSVSHA